MISARCIRLGSLGPASRLWLSARPTSSCRTSNSSAAWRSEEHTSELQSLRHLVCRLLLEKTRFKLMVNVVQNWVGTGISQPVNNGWFGAAHVGDLFFNDTATPEIYPPFPTRRSSD